MYSKVCNTISWKHIIEFTILNFLHKITLNPILKNSYDIRSCHTEFKTRLTEQQGGVWEMHCPKVGDSER
jgi:hypothetical protein